jgi:hypothetical protein
LIDSRATKTQHVAFTDFRADTLFFSWRAFIYNSIFDDEHFDAVA